MKYEQFIESLKPLLEEAATLFGFEALHGDPRFRKWRHQVTDLIERIEEQGYSVNSSIVDRQFDEHGSYTYTPSNRERLDAYDRDLQDTIIELQTIVERYNQFGDPKKPQQSSKEHKQTELIARFKQHWLISLLILCSAVASGTWMLVIQVLVNPRDFEIARLEKALEDAKQAPHVIRDSSPTAGVVLSDGIFEGASATTSDGLCNIYIKTVSGNQVSLVVSVKSEKPQTFERVEAGQRISVAAGSLIYYLDIRRIRGNIVDITATRQI